MNYNVFITRELNTKITPDKAYVTERGAARRGALRHLPPGLQRLEGPAPDGQPTSRCATTRTTRSSRSRSRRTTRSPTAAQTLDPKECIPQAGSVAQQGPTSGSMLLFQLPLATTENRPLELEIEPGAGEKRTFTLDI